MGKSLHFACQPHRGILWVVFEACLKTVNVVFHWRNASQNGGQRDDDVSKNSVTPNAGETGKTIIGTAAISYVQRMAF